MRPKRSLGQHFLVNSSIVDRIVAFAELAAEPVLEVGPGKGILTRGLITRASSVLAVEKDDELFEKLGETFKGQENLRLIHGDILDMELGDLLVDGMKIIANLPYNIASRFIIRLLKDASKLAAVVVMVQREVAERVCACPGDTAYSALSVLVSSAFDSHRGFVVHPANFSPRPKVDSQVLKLIPRPCPVAVTELDTFQDVVFCAFRNRRKMLKNSLVHLPGMKPDVLEYLARETGVDLKKRPQDIPQEVYRLFAAMYREQAASTG
ncbi:MAG: 16S rRNA (adenine(1518)-N(6)/adenine(1519)-N(6))-dimethyltransferase RsmA [Desulfomonilia bacterium]